MHRSNYKKRKFYNRGMTLAELVVTFLLLSIFMVAATFVITSIMSIYYRVQGQTYGLQVSNIIQNKIAGELEGAVSGNITSDDYDSTSVQGAIFIYNDEQTIEFENASGSHVKLETYSKGDKNYLLEHFYEVSGDTDASDDGATTDDGDSGDDSSILFEAVDWRFDEAVYMDYSITTLQFSSLPASEYEGNVIKVYLVLNSDRYGEYESVRYIECYNFDDAADISKIHVKEAALPDTGE